MAADDVKLIVSIAPDGTVTAETKNVTGDKCLDYVTVLEDLLEAETVSSKYTEDHTRTTVAPVVAQEERNELGRS